MISLREFIIGVIVALAFYATELFVFIRAARKPARGNAEALQQKKALAQLREEVSDLGAKVSALQKDIEKLKDENQSPAPYSQAIRLVRQGMGPADIAVACNISKGEAELIASLHKGR